MADGRPDGGSPPSGLPSRFGWSALSNYALTATLMVVALVTTPVLTRHLGPQGFGIWIFVGSTVAYIQLLDLGFGGAVVSAVARLSAAGDQQMLERTLNSSFFLLLGLGALGLLLSGLASLFLPAVLHLSVPLERTTRVLLLLLGVDIALSIPMDTFGCGLVALQRYDLLNATLVTVALADAVALVLVLVCGGGLVALGVVTVAISLVGQGVRVVVLRRLLPTLQISWRLVDRAALRSLFSPAAWYALGDSIEAFRDYASVFVLGLVRNVTTSGIFAVGEKLATLGTKLGSPLTEPFFPHAASLAGTGDTDGLTRAAHTGSRLTAGVTIPCCVVVVVMARPALVAWVGPAFAGAVPAAVILGVAFGLRSLGAAGSKIVSGSGGQRLIAMTSVAEVSVQIALTAVLGVFFGITGVACAVLASVVGVELAVTLPLVARRLGTSVARLVVPVLRAHVPPIVVAGAVGWLVVRPPALDVADAHGKLVSVAAVGAAGLAVLVVYGIVFVVSGLDRGGRRRLLDVMRRPSHIVAAWRHGEAAPVEQYPV